ncbi:TPA: hypothetical protein ACX6SH_004241 [Photobacterium damselae]
MTTFVALLLLILKTELPFCLLSIALSQRSPMAVMGSLLIKPPLPPFFLFVKTGRLILLALLVAAAFFVSIGLQMAQSQCALGFAVLALIMTLHHIKATQGAIEDPSCI